MVGCFHNSLSHGCSTPRTCSQSIVCLLSSLKFWKSYRRPGTIWSSFNLSKLCSNQWFYCILIFLPLCTNFLAREAVINRATAVHHLVVSLTLFSFVLYYFVHIQDTRVVVFYVIINFQLTANVNVSFFTILDRTYVCLYIYYIYISYTYIYIREC